MHKIICSNRITFTRWVYNRGGSRYGFVLDRFNRVVQVEAIGLQNAKVKTRRGVGFGSTFAQIIKKYQAPDGYEVSGDTIVVRYLIKAKCPPYYPTMRAAVRAYRRGFATTPVFLRTGGSIAAVSALS